MECWDQIAGTMNADLELSSLATWEHIIVTAAGGIRIYAGYG